MLDAQQTQRLRAHLEDQRRRIVDNARDARDFARNQDQNRTGRDSLDQSNQEELYSTVLSLRDRENSLLAKIDRALIRLESGAMGECEECGEDIGFERLAARPMTTLCIDCQSDQELSTR